MKIKELTEGKTDLTSSEMSYQIIVTFDLYGAESSDYQALRDALLESTELGRELTIAREDGGGTAELPFNTLAITYHQDSSAAGTRKYIEQEIIKVMADRGLRGRFLVCVGSDWSAGVTHVGGNRK